MSRRNAPGTTGICRYCHVQMTRDPVKKRKLRPGQTYYYTWQWRCGTCRRIYLADEARVEVDPDNPKRTKRQSAAVMWFAKLEEARNLGNKELANECRERLFDLGIIVKFACNCEVRHSLEACKAHG